MYDKRIFANNLKRFMDSTDRNQSDIARVTGASQSAVSAWVRGEKTPRMDKVTALARLFGCTIADLIEDGRSGISTHRVPRVGTISCGSPLLAEQNIEGYDEVPDFVKCDYTIVCKGDSMTGARINDGDIVCVRACNTARNGDIVVVGIEGDDGSYEATLKRIRFADNGIMLCPENLSYVPLVFAGEQMARVHIQGIATHFISTIK